MQGVWAVEVWILQTPESLLKSVDPESLVSLRVLAEVVDELSSRPSG